MFLFSDKHDTKLYQVSQRSALNYAPWKVLNGEQTDS